MSGLIGNPKEAAHSQQPVAPRIGISFVPDPLDASGLDLRDLGRLAARAEEAGFHRVAVSDHLLFHVPTPDPVVCLAAMAEATSSVRLATQVLILPLRHPLQVAQSFASLDRLSAGRVELGVGVGGEWPADYHALGVSLGSRGRRADEALRIIRALWAGGPVTVREGHFRLENVMLPILPCQRPQLPIVVGGRSSAALERAARYAERWDGIFLDARQLARRRLELEERAAAHGREVACGLVAWAAVGPQARARNELARRISEFYRLPFERFERSAVYGPLEACKERLAELAAAGAGDVTLIPAGDLEEQLDALAPLAATARAAGAAEVAEAAEAAGESSRP